ncbi:3880_t:CDS:2 [Scutellospora calospora]|uniref:3880_t:CDS:1 n=1 Tax=Scutellospora calospora TaxID=85575 RepID=A0ACA9N7H5_9GLOM|nr:3880_t:CDS:2 [Scutellospora calospora]
MSTSPNTPEEYNKEEILQSLQNLSFEETAAINEENLNKNLGLAQKVKFYTTTSIHIYLQQQHNLLLEKEKLNFIIKKYSVEIQAEKLKQFLNRLS